MPRKSPNLLSEIRQNASHNNIKGIGSRSSTKLLGMQKFDLLAVEKWIKWKGYRNKGITRQAS